MCSAKTDSWTDEGAISYTSLTVLDITGAWEMKPVTVLCRSQRDRHTGEALSNFLVTALKKYAILNKTLCICTDNASNAVAAIRITSEQFSRFVECELSIGQDQQETAGFPHTSTIGSPQDGIIEEFMALDSDPSTRFADLDSHIIE